VINEIGRRNTNKVSCCFLKFCGSSAGQSKISVSVVNYGRQESFRGSRIEAAESLVIFDLRIVSFDLALARGF
jgi:hypothetical protein